MEWLAAFSRISAVVWALVAAITLLFLAAQPSWNAAAAALLAAVFAVGTGWFGFVRLANPEWKDDDGAPDRP